jgi:hypothetical protein
MRHQTCEANNCHDQRSTNWRECPMNGVTESNLYHGL